MVSRCVSRTQFCMGFISWGVCAHCWFVFFFFQAEDGIRDVAVTGVQTCALPICSSPTNGRGTMTVSSGTGGNAVFYVISPTKLVALSQNDPNPAILVFEQGSTTTTTPPAPTVTLSSLTLNPTSVIGGLQSSTATVTLSGPAPAAGAQVTLSSSNTAVASVPSSVTVPAGATNATLTGHTTIVLFSTSRTISASSYST